MRYYIDSRHPVNEPLSNPSLSLKLLAAKVRNRGSRKIVFSLHGWTAANPPRPLQIEQLPRAPYTTGTARSSGVRGNNYQVRCVSPAVPKLHKVRENNGFSLIKKQTTKQTSEKNREVCGTCLTVGHICTPHFVKCSVPVQQQQHGSSVLLLS